MPRKPCFWTRKLELDLVEFVYEREFIWKPFGNTNHHIQQKYKAYAEFAAKLGRGFTARSVRDRWVNIRSTFNHNLRRVDKSKETAATPADIYVPCWPLWKPLQFLREMSKKEDGSLEIFHPQDNNYGASSEAPIKEELQSEVEDPESLNIRQRGLRTNRPRRKIMKSYKPDRSSNKCHKLLDDLVKAMKPLTNDSVAVDQSYWFFGKHVTEQLNCMKRENGECASREILALLDNCTGNNIT